MGLDKLLGGGISGGIITDIFGPGGSGKTHLAMQICVGAINGKIIFQDTTGSFRPERMLQIMQARQVPQNLLDNVIVARVTNTAEQVAGLDRISEILPALVVIDNVSELFSFEYSKESSLIEKHVRFMEYMHALSLECIRNKVAAVVTNTVRGPPEQERESLDKSISIFTHKKIRLSKREGRNFAEVLPSFGARKEIAYRITQEGISEAG